MPPLRFSIHAERQAEEALDLLLLVPARDLLQQVV